MYWRLEKCLQKAQISYTKHQPLQSFGLQQHIFDRQRGIYRGLHYRWIVSCQVENSQNEIGTPPHYVFPHFQNTVQKPYQFDRRQRIRWFEHHKTVRTWKFFKKHNHAHTHTHTHTYIHIRTWKFFKKHTHTHIHTYTYILYAYWLAFTRRDLASNQISSIAFGAFAGLNAATLYVCRMLYVWLGRVPVKANLHFELFISRAEPCPTIK